MLNFDSVFQINITLVTDFCMFELDRSESQAGRLTWSRA